MKKSMKGKLASVIMAGAMMASVAVPASAASISDYTATAPRYSCGQVSQVVSQAKSTVANMNKETEDLADAIVSSGNPMETFANGIKNIANENSQSFLNGIGA